MDTKTKILDAAERLFGEKGIDGTSLRAITRAAEVNLAAVNYHFQSKDSLLQAVIARRIQPMNERRMELLRDVEAATGGNPPVEALLDALMRPIFELAFKLGPDSAADFRKLAGRMFGDPDIRPKLMLQGEIAETVAIFVAAIERAIPGIERKEIFWGLSFLMGSMSHTLVSGGLIEGLSGGLCRTDESEPLLRRIVTYAAAGLRALAASVSPDGGVNQ